MSEHRLGEIAAYSYLVDRGKPVACLALKETEVGEALEYVRRAHGLKTIVEPLGDGWEMLWIYKKPFVKELIENAPEGNEVVAHWYWGKLFGYSDEEIEVYLDSCCLNAHEVASVAFRTGRKGIGGIVQTDELAALGAPINAYSRLLSRCRHIITSFSWIFAAAAKSILLRVSDRKNYEKRNGGHHG